VNRRNDTGAFAIKFRAIFLKSLDINTQNINKFLNCDQPFEFCYVRFFKNRLLKASISKTRPSQLPWKKSEGQTTDFGRAVKYFEMTKLYKILSTIDSN